MRSERNVDLLVDAWDSPTARGDVSLRFEIVHGLAEAPDDPRALRLFEHALATDPDPAIRLLVARSLRKCEATTIQPLLRNACAVDQHWQTLKTLVRMFDGRPDRESEDVVLRLIEHSSPTIRSESAKALGRIGGSRSVAPIVALLEDSDRTVRLSASSALTALGDVSTLEALSRLLRSERWPWTLVVKSDVRRLSSRVE